MPALRARALTLRRNAILATAALFTAGLAYCGLARSPGAAEGGDAREWVIAEGSLAETVTGTGTVEPGLRVTVKSEVPGLVQTLHFDAGDRVAAGDVLVELDPARLAAQRAELLAAVEVQRALAAEDLEGVARARRKHAEREFERIDQLAERGIVAEREHDDARLALETARLEQRNAGRQAAARRSELERITRSLERVERDLERLVIRSPLSGVVLDRPVERGSPVADVSASNGGTAIATVADDSVLHLLAAFDEDDIHGVAVGQPTEVRVDSLRGEVLAGKVARIAASGRFDRGATLFDVEVALPPEPRLRVGMSGDARVVVARHEHVIVIPNEAIVRDPDGPRVRFANSASPAELVPIEEGYSDGIHTIVRAGVRTGDTILVPRRRAER